MKLNPNNTWKLVEEKLKSETDSTRRRNLELVLAHICLCWIWSRVKR